MTLEHFKDGTFQEAVLAYRYLPSPEHGKLLGGMLLKLAEQMVAVYDAVVLREDATLAHRCALHAFTLVGSFDPDKGKAANYFGASMLNWIKSEWHLMKRQLELEERYGKYLSNRQIDDGNDC